MKVGYVRVSRQDQNLDMQREELKADGCNASWEAVGKQE
jgi:DNA invertase Pin-like site-specific DNA recombinase